MSDDRKDARLYKLAADRGDADAQVHLGLFHTQGRGGLPKDDREAARLFKLAADQGHAAAQCFLGVFYAQGRGGLPNNEREATRLFKLAASKGDALAQRNLGVFFAHGRGGLPQDELEAARLFKLATNQEARTKKKGMFSSLFGHEVHTGDSWRQQQEEHEQQWEAAERGRQRRQEEQDCQRDMPSGKMSAAQAFEVLGISAGATEEDVREAYNRLMKRVHPDVGGSAYFSKQLNAARDVLLRQPRA
jgi:TPR repeat protein